MGDTPSTQSSPTSTQPDSNESFSPITLLHSPPRRLLLPGESITSAENRLGFRLDEEPPKHTRAATREALARGAAWLASEPLWSMASRMGPEPAWKGVKILGEGGNGTAGKWELRYGRPAEGTQGRLPFKTCVVKQQAGDWGDIGNEAKIYEVLRHASSQHVVKMYRRLYEDVGLGTVRADLKGPVQRIYLEYCAQGDLFDMISKKFKEKQYFDEYEIWDVFHCLARGLYAMHSGHENLDEERWDRDEIAHFDFKGQNVFLGDGIRDEEHKGARVMKIGDFGNAKEVPVNQDLAYNFHYRWCGTEPYKLPEQLRTREHELDRPWMDKSPKTMWEAGDGNILKNLRYGTHSNVWQLGIIIWQMIHCTEWEHKDLPDTEYICKGDVQWPDTKFFRPGPKGRFELKLYKVASTWLGKNDAVGGVHTLATQDDIDYYNGMYDALPAEPKANADKTISEAERQMNRKMRAIENRARATIREDRLYSDTLHKLVMDCLIVQGEARIHVKDLYRKTQRFKNFWRAKKGPELPPPYVPEPELGELPAPWDDTTRESGGGLGRPVPEGFESRPLGLFDLFKATRRYERAEEIINWSRKNPIGDDVPDHEVNEAQSLIIRNARHIIGVRNELRMFGGQRQKPNPPVPHPFPKGFIYDRPGEDKGAADPGTGVVQPGQGPNPDPPPPPPISGERATHDKGNPKEPRDFSFEATPVDMKGQLPVPLPGGAGADFKEKSKDKSKRRSKSGSKKRSRSKSKTPTWPEFPIGLQTSLNKSFLQQALEIPELKNTILFCTVIDKSGGTEMLKGIIYLTGLLPTTTVYQMKEMLSEKETGIPVKDMKLMGQDRLTVFREFEDEETRAAIYEIEICVYDITRV
ncbi:eb80d5b9-f1dd-44d8-a9d1-e3274e6b5957 [Sclerotinia trifoliorum]|uniref:Eb80d5b9-f1dd-44d8-a9d1-e3274e6b5957 n=1 Tax=Sclerotinia trifoliorum TaxID=28548 RepID=A0A8H2ZV42_9HELO|nr:eb80d5b9-f1dd-44d8-a9d1-e3274e6b5957 [Sclerotinia trifoliorum]